MTGLVRLQMISTLYTPFGESEGTIRGNLIIYNCHQEIAKNVIQAIEVD